MSHRVFFNAGNWGAEMFVSDPTDEQVEALMMLGTAPHSHTNQEH